MRGGSGGNAKMGEFVRQLGGGGGGVLGWSKWDVICSHLFVRAALENHEDKLHFILLTKKIFFVSFCQPLG